LFGGGAMLGGGVSLAGEAGLRGDHAAHTAPTGVSSQAMAAAPSVHIQIATPDPDSFRRSESYITGQIARAVSRGQRGL
jgi:hypothetical protein